MKPTLKFATCEMLGAKLGEESSVPDLLGSLILQNDLEFHLDEEDEIFQGYGTRKTSFPYRPYNGYNRELVKREVKKAILENEYLCATFLPEHGGRLWSLIDKKTGINLLYTNDVLSYSNLSTRNAWFSGGVEWNMGIIGHTPLTTEPLFTERLTDEEGNPVLRMYEYERISQVEYQMEFWLGEADTYLNCRMRILNSEDMVVPMYWWSNIAVPEYEDGRIVVPSTEAFTNRNGAIYKVDIPFVGEEDISKYRGIHKQIDYFFVIPKEMPKYIANVDNEGYGLLHMSTDRLQSRKLFSWGNNDASNRWQEFLTKDAGKYVEIQAGLSKTQYGCIPMAPHTAWEWIEQYGPIQLEEARGTFESTKEEATAIVCKEYNIRLLEKQLKETKKLAKTKGELIFQGSGYGYLKNAGRKIQGRKGLSRHLDFSKCDEKQKVWEAFLNSGYLRELAPANRPEDYVGEDQFFQLLIDTIENKNQNNWYAHYQLGLIHMDKKNYAHGKRHLAKSNQLKENPWTHHALAALALIESTGEEVLAHAVKGLAMRTFDLSYIKDMFKMLLSVGGDKELIEIYLGLSKELREESRLYFDYINALYNIGETSKAYALLCADGGLVLGDIREGEDSIGELWMKMHEDLFGERIECPPHFNFNSL